MRQYNEVSEKKETTGDLRDVLTQAQMKSNVLIAISVVLGIVTILLVAAVIIISGYPKSQGYVIELTPDGEAVYNPDAVKLLDDWQPKDNTIHYFLREFIIELRSVSSDPQIVQQNVDKLYRQVTGDAVRKVTDYIEETDPIKRLRSETAVIKIASILPLSDTTYQIDFRETVFSSSKIIKSDNHYRCVAHTALYTPRTEEQIAYNPIGLYVTDFDITLVKEI